MVHVRCNLVTVMRPCHQRNGNDHDRNQSVSVSSSSGRRRNVAAGIAAAAHAACSTVRVAVAAANTPTTVIVEIVAVAEFFYQQRQMFFLSRAVHHRRRSKRRKRREGNSTRVNGWDALWSLGALQLQLLWVVGDRHPVWLCKVSDRNLDAVFAIIHVDW